MKVVTGWLVADALACAGCATHAVSPTSTGDAAHPVAARGWVRTELYFGLGAADAASGVSDTAWRAFLDAEVTPRFPSGLTVVDAYGQWRDPGQGTPERLRSKVLILLHPDTPAARADIDAIRAAWKAKTGDRSVLRVTQPAEVSF